MHVNVAPLLLHLKTCFTTLILYEPRDLSLPDYPVAIMSPGHAHFPNNSCREGNELEINNEGVCPYVLDNYKIKGTRCVGAMSVYPSKGYGEKDIYWYLNYYWSRSETQVRVVRQVVNGGIKYTRYTTLGPFFPTRIYIQALITPESFEQRGNKASSNQSLKREWLPFLTLPLLLVIASEMKNKSLFYEGKRCAGHDGLHRTTASTNSTDGKTCIDHIKVNLMILVRDIPPAVLPETKIHIGTGEIYFLECEV